MSFQYNTVHRNILTGAYDKDISFSHLIHRDLPLDPILNHGRGLWCQLHQAFERIGGFSLGMCLQHLTDGDQRQNHGCRFKIKLVHQGHDLFRIPFHLCIGHGKDRVSAVHKGCHGTKGNQRVHIRSSVPEASESADEKLLINDHNNRSQNHLQKAVRDMIPLQKRGNRPVPHHMSHGKIHQDKQKSQRREQTPLQHRCLTVFQHLFRGRCPG